MRKLQQQRENKLDELQKRINKASNENTILQPKIPERNNNGTGSRQGNERASTTERTGTLDFGGEATGSNQSGSRQTGTSGTANRPGGSTEANDGIRRNSNTSERNERDDAPGDRGSEERIPRENTSQLLNRPDQLAGNKVDVDFTKEKTPYPAKSKSQEIGSVVPTNVAQTLSDVLSVLKDIDQYVQIKLGYNSKDELYNALAAEQIDSDAMGFYQIENNGMVYTGILQNP